MTLHTQTLSTTFTNNFCACQSSPFTDIQLICSVFVEFITSFFHVLTCFNGCVAEMDARLGFGTRLRWFCDRFVTVSWPFRDRFVTVSWPFRDRFVTVSWPFRDRFVTVSWPFRDRFVTVSWPFRDRFVTVSWPFRDRFVTVGFGENEHFAVALGSGSDVD